MFINQEVHVVDLSKTGKLIAQLRREKSLTQKVMAEKLNICAQTVSKWETGNGFPDITLIPKPSKILVIVIEASL